MTATTTAPLTPRLAMHKVTPELYRAMIALDRAAESFDPTLRELINIRVSQINGCAFCLDMHTKDARVAGESEQRIYALAAWRETPFFSPRERAALALAEAVTLLSEGHVPDAVYDAAAEQFAQNELARLIWRITIINAWNRIAISTRMVPGSYQPRRSK